MAGNAKRRREFKQARKTQVRQVNIGKGQSPLQWVRLERGPDLWAQGFASETDTLLDPRTATKLRFIRAALHVRDFGPDGRPVPLLSVKIKYRYLSDFTLKALETLGIPARSGTPFDFHYAEVLLPGLPSEVNRELLFDNLVDVMYCYWAIQRGMKYVEELQLYKAASRSRSVYEGFARFIEQSQGVPKEEVLKDKGKHLDIQLMEAKWFADATLIKMRALWDKMLLWLSEKYYHVELRSPKWPGKLNELTAGKFQKLPDGAEKHLLGGFVSMCQEIGELKDYRDEDLHLVSRRIQDVFGRTDGWDADNLWAMLQMEMIKCTEGLMVCFAIMLAAAGKIPMGTVINPSQGKA